MPLENLPEIIMASIWDVRIGVPVAVVYGLSPFVALGIAAGSSAATVLPSLIVLRSLLLASGRYFPGARQFLLRLTQRNRPLIEKYGYIGILVSVALPIPGTGPWVGAVTAVLLDLDFVKSAMSLALAIILAGLISLGIAEGVTALIPFFD
ncbi:MAG: small multi-drug export protein [Bacillota bacterium]